MNKMQLHRHYFGLMILLFFFSCNKTQEIKQTELSSKGSEANVPEQESPMIGKERSPAGRNQTELDGILKNDFNTLNISEIPRVWAKRYDLLPEKFKNTVYIGKDAYEVKNNENEVEELIRGFHWSCGNNEKMNQLGELISVTLGYDNPELSYKSGMVYFYFKQEVLNCAD